MTPDPLALARTLEGLRHDLAGVLTIGVTGTKGKTSTTEFIAQLMAARGLRTAVSTSESARIGARPVAVCEHLGDFRAFVRRCRRARIQCLVVELCSFALRWDVHRGLDLDAAVVTSIGTEHISDHGSVRNYVAVKRRMFRDLRARPASPTPVAIVNADDARAGEFRRDLASGVRVATYSLRAGAGASRKWAARVRHTDRGTTFTVHGLAARPLPCRTRLHGDFNVANVLAALACAVALGGDPRRSVAAAGALVPPPGRFTLVGVAPAHRPTVVVDYAHTPESVGAALAAARDLRPRGRVHAVFGCGGDCYKGKRPLMGAVAARRADSVIITSDNPRTEDPRSIARAILRGIPPGHRRNVRVELDRARAIHQAVAGAADGDVVLLLGKGAERTQEIGGTTSPFSDLQMARRALDARAGLCQHSRRSGTRGAS